MEIIKLIYDTTHIFNNNTKRKTQMSMTNFKKVSCLFLGGILFFACSQDKNKLEPRRTVIAGVVNNFSDDANALVVHYCNNFSDENLFAQNLTGSNGHFLTEHEYLFAQNLTIRFANKFITVFVHPGDSIFVTIDANEIQHNFNKAVTFAGNNSEFNEELFLWYNYSSHLFNQNLPQFDVNASPEELLESIRQNFDSAQDLITTYSERTGMSDFLKRWAYVDLKYTIANYLTVYFLENKNKEAMWDIFTDPIFDVFDENNFQTMMFQYHLSACRLALTQSEVEFRRLATEKKHVSFIQLAIGKLFEKAPKGVVRDVILFDFLKVAIVDKPELYDSIPDIKKLFSQNFFHKELEKLSEKARIEQTPKLLESERQLNGILYMTDSGEEEFPDVKLLNFLSEKHKGKVLYIDIWTTWCAPCIKEFKSTPNLHKYFKDKDVVFVNLCLSSSIDSWKPTILKHDVGGENYFLDNNSSLLFMGENNLEGYPSYLIIDKEGAIHNPAPKPSDLESAIKKIEACL